MRRDLLLTLLCSMGLFGSLAADAQGPIGPGAQGPPAPGDTLHLSLEDCVRRAIESGEEVGAAEADLASARASYLQARADALPQLNLATSYTRQIESVFRDTGPGIDPFEADTTADLDVRVREVEKALPTAWLAGLGDLFGSTAFASENTWNATLTLGQKILDGGSLWNSIRGARHALRSAEQAQQDRIDDAVLGVREAYLGALLADRGVHIAELGLTQADSQLQRIRLRQETGLASEFELLQAQVQRDNQLPLVTDARSLREMAYLELARLANLPPGPLGLTTPLLEREAVPADPAPLDTTGLVPRALATPGVLALTEAVQAYSAAVAVAKSGHWPALSVFASFSEQAYPEDPFPVADDWKRDIRAGAEISWSLFDGLRTKGSVEQARAQQLRARQSLRQMQERIRQAVLRSALDLQRAAMDLQSRSRTVELARRVYELASLRYEEGASDLLEVADARIAYQIAQTNEARGRHDYFLALARLERYSGQPLFTAAVPSGSR
ncbi:MAG: TolC family protein [Candidatus Eisenbacteria bacterium]